MSAFTSSGSEATTSSTSRPAMRLKESIPSMSYGFAHATRRRPLAISSGIIRCRFANGRDILDSMRSALRFSVSMRMWSSFASRAMAWEMSSSVSGAPESRRLGRRRRRMMS